MCISKYIQSLSFAIIQHLKLDLGPNFFLWSAKDCQSRKRSSFFFLHFGLIIGHVLFSVRLDDAFSLKENWTPMLKQTIKPHSSFSFAKLYSGLRSNIRRARACTIHLSD